MKYTLVLNSNGATAEQLEAFALNDVVRSAPIPNIKYTYTCQALQSDGEQKSDEEQKRSAEQSGNPTCPFTRVDVSRDTTGQKSILMYFPSLAASRAFIQQHGGQDLRLNRLFFNPPVLMIQSQDLTLTACKKFKSILVTDCNLDETSVDNILHIAFLAEFTKIQKKREEILVRFKNELGKFFHENAGERKAAYERVEGIDKLAQKLMSEAEIFDKQENRHEAAVTLALGNLFLSFHLREEALTSFKKISECCRQYSAAQTQIVNLYLTNNQSVDGVQSLDQTPDLDYTGIEQAYLAACAANQPDQCAIIANLLCGLEAERFTDADFTVDPGAREDYRDAAIIQYHMNNFVKACQIIRAQQAEIKRLNGQAVARTSSIPSSSAPSSSSSSSSSSFGAALSSSSSCSSNLPQAVNLSPRSDQVEPEGEHTPRVLIWSLGTSSSLNTGTSSSMLLSETAVLDGRQEPAVQLLTETLNPAEAQAPRYHVRRPSGDGSP